MALNLRNRSLRITTLEYVPYTTKLVHEDGRVEFGGLCALIIQAMAEQLNFHPVWVEPADDKWGSNSSGVWNGMIGDVLRGEADIAAAGLSITVLRDAVIDYLYPYKEESLGVLVREMDGGSDFLFAVFQPFSLPLWLTILAAAVFVSTALWLIALAVKCSPDPLAKSFSRPLWYCFTSILNQGQFIQARATAVRCVAGAWLFCCVVLYATYCANLTASLTVKRHKMPFDTLEEMVGQTEYKYGVYRDGLAGLVFQSADSGIYKSIYDGISSDPSNFVDSGPAALHKISTENYAYISDTTFLEMETIGECTMRLIKQKFYKTGLAFAVPENWEYKQEFDMVMLRLLESGVVERWIKDVTPISQCDDVDHAYIEAQQISLEDIASPLCMLAAGIIVATVVLAAERGLHTTAHAGKTCSKTCTKTCTKTCAKTFLKQVPCFNSEREQLTSNRA